MNKRLRFLIALIMLSWTAACTLPLEPPGLVEALQPGDVTRTAAAVTGAATAIPAVQPISDSSQKSSGGLGEATQGPIQAPSTEPSQPPTVGGPQGIASKPQCINRAAPGRPLDLTVPDGQTMQPGQSFSKTWRLVNDGTCAWTRGYAVVWFSGEEMSAASSLFLHEIIEPGGTVDVTVDMVAPLQAGVYQGNWMLSDEASDLFGIGPSGQSAFWVRIQVVEQLASPSPGARPTPSATPVVFNGGELTLYLQDWMDLDSGMINTGSTDDLTFQMEKEKAVLRPASGTRIAVFGARTPTESDCRDVRLSSESLMLDSLKEGVFLCYRSNQGLPGYARLPVINLKDNFLKLEFLTWSAP